MNKQRFEALTEGIFAIVMTLLVIEIKVPEIHHIATNLELWEAIKELTPLFLSFILSFTVLATLWRAHVFMISYYAKSIYTHIININIIFFFLVALLPFSAHLLGAYHYTQFAIIFYGLNISLLSLTLYGLRTYMRISGNIDSEKFYTSDRKYTRIRILLPLLCSMLAIPLSFWNTNISIIMYTFVVLFNFLPGGIVFIENIVNKILGRNIEV